MKKRLSKNQVRKLVQEIEYIAIALVGIILSVCNFFKIVPETYGILTVLIAYGCLIGPGLFVLGVYGFIETRNTKVSKFSKKAR